jgi:dienelactone hydrolase
MWLRGCVSALSLLLFGAAQAAAEPGPPSPALAGGLTGEFFPPPTGKGLLVLYLGGSEGGVPRGSARDLSNQGFGVLALGYFKAPGLSATLESVPLEYFDKAIDWLAAQPSNAHRRIAIVGVSKGAEAALLVAARNSQVCAVVTGAPSSVAWQGFNPQNPMSSGPSWTVGGHAVPYAPYDVSAPFTSLRDLYARSLAKAAPAAQLPIERIKGPVLLVSGREDAVWPSTQMADALVSRAERLGKKDVKHLAFDQAGHAAFGKPAPSVAVIPPALVAQSGGTAEGNQQARLKSWSATTAFLSKAQDDC